jgi:hypothetical protein
MKRAETRRIKVEPTKSYFLSTKRFREIRRQNNIDT